MEKQYTIKEFEKVSGIKAANLRHYDSLGILKPTARAKNGYRIYGNDQLATAYALESMRSLGFSLADINRHLKSRNPANTIGLMESQIKKVDGQIKELTQIKNMLSRFIDDIQLSEEIILGIIQLERDNRINIRIGPFVNPLNYVDEPDVAVKFIKDCRKDAPANISEFGYIIPKAFFESKNRDELKHSRLFIIDSNSDEYILGGLCAVSYNRRCELENKSIFDNMSDYLEKSLFEACGDSCFVCLRNEISENISDNFLFRLSVPIRKR
jgi:DNA-binding transcriptional MerR regulator